MGIDHLKQDKEWRKTAVIIRLFIIAVLILLLAFQYVDDDTALQNTYGIFAGISLYIMVFLLIDTVITLLWILSSTLMNVHFWLHLISWVIFVILTKGIVLPAALIDLIPFFVYIIRKQSYYEAAAKKRFDKHRNDDDHV